MTNPVRWSTQGGDFNTDYTFKVENALVGLNLTKSVTWNFHLDELQDTYWYIMILGSDILYKINR